MNRKIPRLKSKLLNPKRLAEAMKPGVLNLKVMQTENCNKTCQSNDLILNLKATRRPRFKAGAELSGAVNIMDVNVDQEIGENYEALEIKIRLTTETCVPTVVVD